MDLAFDLGAYLNYVSESMVEADVIYNQCPNCKIAMEVKFNNQYVCTACGLVNEKIEVVDMSCINSDYNYNSMATGVRCIGNNAHRYQSILRSSTTTEISPEQQAQNVLFTYSHKRGNNIPKDILLSVAEQFVHCKIDGSIYRGSMLRAILAAITYYECLKRCLSFRPSDIYIWFDVDPTTYSKGDKKVRELLDHGHFKQNLREVDADQNYLHAYATKLQIDTKHIDFMHDIMDRTVSLRILNPNAKSTTKSLCVVYMYIQAVNYSIKAEEFKTMFNCNVGTIRSLTMNLIRHLSSFIDIFESYSIPYDRLDSEKSKATQSIVRKIKKSGRTAVLTPDQLIVQTILNELVKKVEAKQKEKKPVPERKVFKQVIRELNKYFTEKKQECKIEKPSKIRKVFNLVLKEVVKFHDQKIKREREQIEKQKKAFKPIFRELLKRYAEIVKERIQNAKMEKLIKIHLEKEKKKFKSVVKELGKHWEKVNKKIEAENATILSHVLKNKKKFKPVIRELEKYWISIEKQLLIDTKLEMAHIAKNKKKFKQVLSSITRYRKNRKNNQRKN